MTFYIKKEFNKFMKKQLIINADDFGIHETVNLAIYRAVESGILTSASLMASGSAFEDAVHIAKNTENLGVGVHLTLVGGLPTVLPKREVPSLTWDNGLLCKNYIELLRKDIKGLINADEVYREWDAQIKKIIDAGISVTHLDGHQHLHMWNKFFPIAVTLAKKYDIPCMRVPDEKFFFGIRPKNIFRSIAGTGLSAMARQHRKVLDKTNIHTNDHFYGMLYGGHFTLDRMRYVVNKLPKGVTEFMCHPSTDEAVMEKSFHWGYHGEDELHALLSTTLRHQIENSDIQLISYRDLSYNRENVDEK